MTAAACIMRYIAEYKIEVKMRNRMIILSGHYIHYIHPCILTYTHTYIYSYTHTLLYHKGERLIYPGFTHATVVGKYVTFYTSVIKMYRLTRCPFLSLEAPIMKKTSDRTKLSRWPENNLCLQRESMVLDVLGNFLQFFIFIFLSFLVWLETYNQTQRLCVCNISNQ